MTGEMKAAFILIMAGTLSASVFCVFFLFSPESPGGGVFFWEKEKKSKRS